MNTRKLSRPVIGLFVLLTLALSISLFAQEKTLDRYLQADKFSFGEAPVADLGEPLVLWATNYHMPELLDGSGDVPLRDIEGNELGPKLSLLEWCKSALEGSVRIIFKDGSAKTYNYDASTELFPNDCSAYFTFNLGKTKFKLANGPYGDGIRNYRLTPYRTLATDPTLIPTGTVLYIPDARGAVIAFADGSSITHDGYFFAGDLGGAIKLNHIDVFIGSHRDSPFFPWIKHSSEIPFKAYIVKDPKIISDLTALHLRR